MKNLIKVSKKLFSSLTVYNIALCLDFAIGYTIFKLIDWITDGRTEAFISRIFDWAVSHIAISITIAVAIYIIGYIMLLFISGAQTADDIPKEPEST